MATAEERRKYQREWKRAAGNHAPQRRPADAELANIKQLLLAYVPHADIAKQTGWSKALIDKIARGLKRPMAVRPRTKATRQMTLRTLTIRLLMAGWSYEDIHVVTRLRITKIRQIDFRFD